MLENAFPEKCWDCLGQKGSEDTIPELQASKTQQ